MAVIEFENLETLEAFKPIIQEIEQEEKNTQAAQAHLKRTAELLRAGLWNPADF